jgi:hypothetical protein
VVDELQTNVGRGRGLSEGAASSLASLGEGVTDGGLPSGSKQEG